MTSPTDPEDLGPKENMVITHYHIEVHTFSPFPESIKSFQNVSDAK